MSERGSEVTKSYELEEILQIAEAIADRELREAQVVQNLMAANTGEEAELLPDNMRQKILVARTALLIQQIENPTTKLSIDETIDVLLSNGSCDTLAAKVSEGSGEEVSGEQVKDLIKGFSKRVLDEAGIDDAKSTELFVKTFEAAKQVAAERKCSIADVYREEELFIEIYKKAYTPEEFVTQQIKASDAISEKTINALLVHMVETLVPADMREEMSDEEMAELLTEMQLDPDIQKSITQAAEMGQTAAKSMAASYVIRIWGSETLHNLPTDMQEKLGVDKDILVTEVGNIAIEGANTEQVDLLVMREAFVNNYFTERGWDVDNPTMEQILEVHSQPGWRNPIS